MSEQQHSVAGGWLGTYTYRGSQRTIAPVRFEATLGMHTEGHFTGTILDDGPGGEAHVDGMQGGDQVQFTKSYQPGSARHRLPVEYEGALSEDGLSLKGTWQIAKAHLGHGAWEARRLWSEEGEHEKTEEPESVTRELATEAT